MRFPQHHIFAPKCPIMPQMMWIRIFRIKEFLEDSVDTHVRFRFDNFQKVVKSLFGTPKCPILPQMVLIWMPWIKEFPELYFGRSFVFPARHCDGAFSAPEAIPKYVGQDVLKCDYCPNAPFLGKYILGHFGWWNWHMLLIFNYLCDFPNTTLLPQNAPKCHKWFE